MPFSNPFGSVAIIYQPPYMRSMSTLSGGVWAPAGASDRRTGKTRAAALVLIAPLRRLDGGGSIAAHPSASPRRARRRQPVEP